MRSLCAYYDNNPFRSSRTIISILSSVLNGWSNSSARSTSLSGRMVPAAELFFINSSLFCEFLSSSQIFVRYRRYIRQRIDGHVDVLTGPEGGCPHHLLRWWGLFFFIKNNADLLGTSERALFPTKLYVKNTDQKFSAFICV